MYKYIGTIGFHIRFNESSSAALKFLEVFSSSDASKSLFSASTNSSKGLSLSLSSASSYINSKSSSVVYDNEWQQIIFAFNPKLKTKNGNNFLVRFGNTTKGDFQIQNLFIVDKSLNPLEIRYINNEFTSNNTAIIAGDSSVSMTVSDKDEKNHTASTTGTIYQPLLPNQLRYKFDIDAVTSCSVQSGVILNNDDKYFDTYELNIGERVLSLQDNKVYILDTDSKLQIESTSNGDYVKILSGMKYRDSAFVKKSGSFIKTELLEKIDSNNVEFLPIETIISR